MLAEDVGILRSHFKTPGEALEFLDAFRENLVGYALSDIIEGIEWMDWNWPNDLPLMSRLATGQAAEAAWIATEEADFELNSLIDCLEPYRRSQWSDVPDPLEVVIRDG